jgi:hypothetical protein
MASKRLHHPGASTSFREVSNEPWNTAMASSLPIKLVAAEAGFFPPGPCTDFADILGLCEVAEPGNLQSRANGSIKV